MEIQVYLTANHNLAIFVGERVFFVNVANVVANSTSEQWEWLATTAPQVTIPVLAASPNGLIVKWGDRVFFLIEERYCEQIPLNVDLEERISLLREAKEFSLPQPLAHYYERFGYQQWQRSLGGRRAGNTRQICKDFAEAYQ